MAGDFPFGPPPNRFNFSDDTNKIQINDADKKRGIEGAMISANKDNNKNAPIDNNIFEFIDSVIDKNNEENNKKEKKFDSNQNLDNFFDFTKNNDDL